MVQVVEVGGAGTLVHAPSLVVDIDGHNDGPRQQDGLHFRPGRTIKVIRVPEGPTKHGQRGVIMKRGWSGGVGEGE